MSSFVPGLFVGHEAAELPQDNLDLERWFKQPKGHERRMHGHRHAGVRIVQEGPTLLLALDAHLAAWTATLPPRELMNRLQAAGVGAGIYESVSAAVANLVHVSRRFEPDAERGARYHSVRERLASSSGT